MVHSAGLEPTTMASECATFRKILLITQYIVYFCLYCFHILCISFITSTPFDIFYRIRVYIGCRFSGCIFLFSGVDFIGNDLFA